MTLHGILLSRRAVAPSYYLNVLDTLHKRVCRTVGPTFAASLETLGHRRNVASLSFFCMYYFGGCSFELIELVSLPYSLGRSTCYSDRCMVFVFPFLGVIRMSTVSFHS